MRLQDVVGAGTLLGMGGASAAAVEFSAPMEVSSQWVIGILCSIIGALLLFAMKQLQDSITANKEMIHQQKTDTETRFNLHAHHIGELFSKTSDLRADMNGNYHTKQEIKEAVRDGVKLALAESSLSLQVGALHRRLDDIDSRNTRVDKKAEANG